MLLWWNKEYPDRPFEPEMTNKRKTKTTTSENKNQITENRKDMFFEAKMKMDLASNSTFDRAYSSALGLLNAS